MSSGPTRVRMPLRPAQAVTHTSAMRWDPVTDTGKPGVVLGHGAGSDLANPVLLAVARELAARGHPVLTFNFAYAEAGRKPPDRPARLEAAFVDAITGAEQAMGPRPLVLGGRSMGGRIASLVAAAGQPCAGLILLGYPLHPPGRPERLRTAHWPALRVPVLFVQGDRDRLCDLDLLERERAALLTGAPSTVHVLAGADHAFAVRKSDGRSASSLLEEVSTVVGDWLETVGAG